LKHGQAGGEPQDTDLNAMTKVLSTLGVFGCVLMLVVYLNAPSARSVEAREDGVSCRTVIVPVDEGYGVSQTETRKVCKAN
jgi:hypothetical protein